MEKEAFTRIAEMYLNDVIRVSYSICHNRSDAEDIAQMVFEDLYRCDTVFENDEHVKKWLIRVTLNKSRSLLRTPWKRKVDLYLPECMQKKNSTPSNEKLLAAMGRLKQKYRTLIYLFYYEDMSVKEIAEMMEMTESAVKTNLCRARQDLKKKMEGEKT